MSDELWWYLARTSGLTAWVLFMATVFLGTLLSSRLVVRRPGLQQQLRGLHPYLGALGVGALAAHVGSILMDARSGFGLTDALVPFASSWNPSATAYGIVALWLLAVVEVTSVARRRLARRTWHRLHLASYGMAWLMTLHAVFAGTDTSNEVVALGALAAIAAVTALTIRRALAVRTRRTVVLPPPVPTA